MTPLTRTIRIAAAAAAILALAAPAAQARPLVPRLTPVHGLPAGGHAVPASPAGNLALAHAQVRAGLVQRAVGMPTAAASPSQGASVAVATSGFHWGDAVIGAGSTLMLALIGGTALVARGRRRGPISA